MTNQNTTSPALHHENQPPDSGSVHESQRRQRWLSQHRSHRHTCCVCFSLECLTNFRGERRRSLYCSSSSHQTPFLLMTNQNTTSTALHHQNQPPDSGSVRESKRQQVWLSLHRSHRHTYAVCVFVRVFYNFPWERSGTTDLSRRPKIFVKTAI